jgi:two-component system, OmpR family, response regulator CpxR
MKSEVSRPKPHGRTILLIDDDVALCNLMAEFFLAHDICLEAVHDGSAGLARGAAGKHDLVLLDVMLPTLDGFGVLKQLRRRTSVPIIMLTARTGQPDRIAGLDAGADDYIVKPFGPHELLARVRAVLRRTGQSRAAMTPIVEVGQIRLNSETREVWKARSRVDVTSFEFDILDGLLRSAGRVVSRDELAAVLYHRDSTPFERSIDVHISHLRKKLEAEDETLIRTVRGIGYLFAAAEEHPPEEHTR